MRAVECMKPLQISSQFPHHNSLHRRRDGYSHEELKQILRKARRAIADKKKMKKWKNEDGGEKKRRNPPV